MIGSVGPVWFGTRDPHIGEQFDIELELGVLKGLRERFKAARRDGEIHVVSLFREISPEIVRKGWEATFDNSGQSWQLETIPWESTQMASVRFSRSSSASS